VVDEPVVDGGAVVPARVLPLHATFDHRLMDGAHLARFVAVLRRCFADPDGALGPAEAEADGA
jgi:pyruvate dehydrogenase E2 component (dihydrolipoamide acetyltransferase)